MKNEGLRTIYYEYPSLSSFVRIDLEYLRKEYTILQKTLPWAVKWKTPFSFLRQFIFLIANYRKIDCVIVTFVGYHSFLPLLFAKVKRIPSFVILNGTDSVGIRELNYGSHLKSTLRFFCKQSLKMATELWPVSRHLISGENDFIGVPLKYGIAVSFPELNKPFSVIPNGFDIEYWTNAPKFEERKGVITIISGSGQIRLKGVDLLLETALKLPHLHFTVVGADKPEGFAVPENVQFTGRLEKEALKTLLYRNRYYMQLSSFEGFGCSLCEAMLTGCIPIGSNVNAIPEIIGETGFILDKKVEADLTRLLNSLNRLPDNELNQLTEKAIHQISNNYSIEFRVKRMSERMRFYQKRK